MRISLRRRRGALLICAVLSAATAASATGAQVASRAGPFQACLEGRLEAWVNAQAALVVNEDPKASSIDDAAVAKWTGDALDGCRAKADSVDQQAAAGFVKRMSRWREHIYERVRDIQARARPD
jgi:hypothetical protein